MDTPVLLISFNRPDHVHRVLSAIRDAQPAELYVFQDGAREGNAVDAEKCPEVRDVVQALVDWNCELHTLHACKFDEGTTAVRLHFLNRYPDRTPLTAEEIEDAHFKIGYLSGQNMNNRKFAKQYVDKVHNRTPYVKHLSRICASPILFRLYQTYRRLTGKTRTPLQMYFGQ